MEDIYSPNKHSFLHPSSLPPPLPSTSPPGPLGLKTTAKLSGNFDRINLTNDVLLVNTTNDVDPQFKGGASASPRMNTAQHLPMISHANQIEHLQDHSEFLFRPNNSDHLNHQKIKQSIHVRPVAAADLVYPMTDEEVDSPSNVDVPDNSLQPELANQNSPQNEEADSTNEESFQSGNGYASQNELNDQMLNNSINHSTLSNESNNTDILIDFDQQFQSGNHSFNSPREHQNINLYDGKPQKKHFDKTSQPLITEHDFNKSNRLINNRNQSIPSKVDLDESESPAISASNLIRKFNQASKPDFNNNSESFQIEPTKKPLVMPFHQKTTDTKSFSKNTAPLLSPTPFCRKTQYPASKLANSQFAHSKPLHVDPDYQTPAASMFPVRSAVPESATHPTSSVPDEITSKLNSLKPKNVKSAKKEDNNFSKEIHSLQTSPFSSSPREKVEYGNPPHYISVALRNPPKRRSVLDEYDIRHTKPTGFGKLRGLNLPVREVAEPPSDRNEKTGTKKLDKTSPNESSNKRFKDKRGRTPTLKFAPSPFLISPVRPETESSKRPNSVSTAAVVTTPVSPKLYHASPKPVPTPRLSTKSAPINVSNFPVPDIDKNSSKSSTNPTPTSGNLLPKSRTITSTELSINSHVGEHQIQLPLNYQSKGDQFLDQQWDAANNHVNGYSNETASPDHGYASSYSETTHYDSRGDLTLSRGSQSSREELKSSGMGSSKSGSEGDKLDLLTVSERPFSPFSSKSASPIHSEKQQEKSKSTNVDEEMSVDQSAIIAPFEPVMSPNDPSGGCVFEQDGGLTLSENQSIKYRFSARSAESDRPDKADAKRTNFSTLNDNLPGERTQSGALLISKRLISPESRFSEQKTATTSPLPDSAASPVLEDIATNSRLLSNQQHLAGTPPRPGNLELDSIISVRNAEPILPLLSKSAANHDLPAAIESESLIKPVPHERKRKGAPGRGLKDRSESLSDTTDTDSEPASAANDQELERVQTLVSSQNQQPIKSTKFEIDSAEDSGSDLHTDDGGENEDINNEAMNISNVPHEDLILMQKSPTPNNAVQSPDFVINEQTAVGSNELKGAEGDHLRITKTRQQKSILNQTSCSKNDDQNSDISAGSSQTHLAESPEYSVAMRSNVAPIRRFVLSEEKETPIVATNVPLTDEYKEVIPNSKSPVSHIRPISPEFCASHSPSAKLSTSKSSPGSAGLNFNRFQPVEPIGVEVEVTEERTKIPDLKLSGFTNKENVGNEIQENASDSTVSINSRGHGLLMVDSDLASLTHETVKHGETKMEPILGLKNKPQMLPILPSLDTTTTDLNNNNGCSRKPVEIHLMKGATGLGLSLEGGKESALGDKPLTIKKVFRGGAADKTGEVKAGDEILAINDIQLLNMTHLEAWNCLKKTPDGPVVIKIIPKDN